MYVHMRVLRCSTSNIDGPDVCARAFFVDIDIDIQINGWLSSSVEGIINPIQSPLIVENTDDYLVDQKQLL